MNLPFGSYSDPPASSTRLVNCYIEQGEQGPVLRGFPGISDDLTIGTRIRAAITINGIRYVVSANKLYRVSTSDVVTELGTVAGGSVRPQMATNGAQVAVLIEPDLWVYTIATGVFGQVTDTDFPGASSIQFIDNYISYTEPNTGRWGISDLADATSYDGLNFATAEGSPDNLLSHIVDHREAFLLGRDSCELWVNAGISGFPFIRSPNGFIEIGCAAKKSPAKLDQSVVWLASDLTVRKLQGATPVRISTHAVERAIRGYTVANAFGLAFKWEGHEFYALTFPEATWVFDATTNQWFELQSYGLSNWRVSCAIEHEGRYYVGDSQSGKFGLLDDVFTEFGDPVVRTWTYAPVLSGDFLSHSRLEILAQMGVGLSTGQGSDPEIMLAKSDDGGQSFMDLPTRKLGQIGKRETRAVWHRIGMSRNRVYRASVSDPVRLKIIGTRLN